MKVFFAIIISGLVCMPLQAQEQRSDIKAKEHNIKIQKEKLKQNISAFFSFSRPSSQKTLLLFKLPEYKRLSILVQSVTLDAQEDLLDLQQALAEEKYRLNLDDKKRDKHKS